MEPLPYSIWSGAKKRKYIYQEELRGVERFSLWVNLTHIPYGILMPPAPALFVICRDVEISSLDVALELFYQLSGEKFLCVYILHCGLPS